MDLRQVNSFLGEAVETLTEITGLEDPLYTKKERMPKHNVPISPLSSSDNTAAGRLLRRRLPGWDKAKHLSASKRWSREAKRAKKEYGQVLDDAAQETWGRPWSMLDYKVSGIGSSEFSTERKEQLRALVKKISQTKAASAAHLVASKYIKKHR